MLSVGGIAAGVMTLIAVLGVMNGFQLGTIEDILEVNSYHLRIQPEDQDGLGPATGSAIRAVSGVAAALPFIDMQTIARGFYAEPHPVLVRAVPSDAFELDPGLAATVEMVSGSFDLRFPGSVVIGAELSRVLGVAVGDTVSILNFASSGFDVRNPVETPFMVTGIYQTGFLEFDLGWSFVSLQDAHSALSVEEPPTWGVKLDNRFADREIRDRLSQLLADREVEAEVVSWREYNRSIFGALRVEKILMMLLLGLIFVVVGVNIYQSLKRSVVERTEEIGILKAIGAPPRAVQAVFVLEGLLIGIVGGTIGTILGLAITENVNEIFRLAELVLNFLSGAYQWMVQSVGHGGRISLFSPTYFYLEEIPSRVLFPELLGIFIFAVASSTLAAYVASTRSARIRPAAVLRYE
jgi:lipoprotein-releasing system permease protein